MAKRPKLTPAEKDTLTKNHNAIRRWYARILEDFALRPRNEPAPK